jgi:DNA-binding response OmpR family regulator
MYAEYLCGQGYSTLQARNADDAFRLATEQRPEIVVTEMLLDCGHTGAALVASLKEDARTQDVPVIVLTGRVFDEDRATAEQAGCDVFLGKPCLPDELAWQIRHLLATGRVPADACAPPGRARVVVDGFRYRDQT